MARGGGRAPPSLTDPAPAPTSPSSGHYLLQLLQKPPSAAASSSSPPTPSSNSISSHHHDPAVAAVGPSHPFPTWPNNDPPSPLLPPSPFPFVPPHAFSNRPWSVPSFPPHSVPHFNFQNSHFPPNPAAFFTDALNHQLGFPRPSDLGNATHQRPPPPSQQRFHQEQGGAFENTLTFGSVKCELWNQDGLPNGNSAILGRSKTHQKLGSEQSSSFVSANSSSIQATDRQDKGGRSPWLKQHRGMSQWLPGDPGKPKGPGRWGNLNESLDVEQVSEKDEASVHRQAAKNNIRHGNVMPDVPLSAQIDDPDPPNGSFLHSVPAADIDESLAQLHGEIAGKHGPALHRLEITSDRASDVLTEPLKGPMLIKDEFRSRNSARQYNGSHKKDHTSGYSRGQPVLNHRMRSRRKEIICRRDLESFTLSFLSIYESLIPAEEEKAKQKQLLASLEKLVNKEWPNAKLYLYGSCANSFGVSNSDIDVCLAIDDNGISKSDILLKLAEILEADNLQNVQALTRARVPIVKLMDPVTGISCDICINNVLAVVNTKLLRDYAQIDARLQPLAFIVKHWAKSRGVNETYRGTLSSYAYVLMCIHFLQQCKPAILPCLQELKATYTVTVDDIECSYFDQVEDLRDYGAQNKESVARLLWAFFDYWAYHHDYANGVISVRTGSIISKRAKEWTTRVGNDRHLICIEDPFEVNHDLGRVVDKYSIKILRDEFERAAKILQYDPNPSVTLFEPYVDGE